MPPSARDHWGENISAPERTALRFERTAGLGLSANQVPVRRAELQCCDGWSGLSCSPGHPPPRLYNSPYALIQPQESALQGPSSPRRCGLVRAVNLWSLGGCRRSVCLTPPTITVIQIKSLIFFHLFTRRYSLFLQIPHNKNNSINCNCECRSLTINLKSTTHFCRRVPRSSTGCFPRLLLSVFFRHAYG